MMRRLVSLAFVVLLAVPLRAASPIPDTAPKPYIPPDAERIVLSNGVIVYLYENHELPLFDIQIRFKASPADDKPEHAFDMLGALWRGGGTQTLPPDKLDEKLESLAASVETGADNETFTVSASCLSRDIDPVLDLWMDVTRNPAFSAEKLAIYKGQAIEALRRKNETPHGIGRRAFRDVLYGPRHVYASDPLPDDVKRVTRRDLQNIHKRVVAPDTAIIAVAGDFEKKTLVDALERRFANWKKTGRADPDFDYSVSSGAAGRVFLVEKDFSQSRVSIGRLGLNRHSPERFKAEVANYILGGGGPSRLFAEIRSRRGLAYMVGSFNVSPTGPGLIGAVSQSQAGATVAVIEAMLKEFSRMATEPVSAEELELAKASMVNASVFSYTRPFSIAVAHATREFYGYPPDELKTRDQKILNVTREDVLEVSKKYYDPAGVKILVVGDPKKFDGKLEKFGDVIRIPLESVD